MSRSPERIDNILHLIKQYWKKEPDLRLGQILGNIAASNPYYLEDDILEKRLIKLIREKEK